MSAGSTLASVAALHLAAMASPGPNVLLVTHTAMARSRRPALAAAAGVACGAALLAAGAALGLGLVIEQARWLHDALRIAGGAYLVFLGVQTWRRAREPLPPADPEAEGGGLGRSYRRGLLTNLTNPKAAVFYGSILATALGAGVPGWVRGVAVAMIFLNAAWWHCLLAVLFARPGVRRGYARVKSRVDHVVGAGLALLGARLALRP